MDRNEIEFDEYTLFTVFGKMAGNVSGSLDYALRAAENYSSWLQCDLIIKKFNEQKNEFVYVDKVTYENLSGRTGVSEEKEKVRRRKALHRRKRRVDKKEVGPSI